MQLSSWLRKFVSTEMLSRRAQPQKKSKLRRPLAAEELEDRRLLSTLTVNSLLDNTTAGDNLVTLREAILASTNHTTTDLGDTGTGADTIVFARGLTGTINLAIVGDTSYGPSALLVNSQITIDANNGAAGITISRDSSVSNLRLFYVTTAGNLTLENLTLSGGQSQGAAGADGSGGGGGATGFGGAIYNQGILTLQQSTLTGNAAVGGNGGAANFDLIGGSGAGPSGGAGGSVGADGDTLAESGQSGQSGGIFSGGGGGGAGGYGGLQGGDGGTGGAGGFGAGGGGGGRSGFSGYQQGSGGAGGAAGFGGGAGGTSEGGGGGGGGAGMGGAIDNDGGFLTITESTLTGNTAAGGTASYGASSGTGLGGAIFNIDGMVAIYNSTLSGNSADQGGGVFNLGASHGASVLLTSSILANTPNGGTDFQDQTINGTNSVSGTNNLIQSQIGFPSAGIVSSADPRLGPLESYGGPTQTLAPESDSPVLGGGSNPLNLTTDQRGTGFPRSFAAAEDIGAFETTPTVTALTTSSQSSVYGDSVTFTATVTSGTGAVPIGTVTFQDENSNVLASEVAVDSKGHAIFTTSGLPASVTGHTITASFHGIGFNASNASTNVSVSKATLTVTADDQSRMYGAANPTLNATISGFKNGETLATGGVIGSPVLNTIANNSSHVNVYPITVALGTLKAANYDFRLAGGNLTVTPAPLTITAGDKSMAYGSASLPTLTVSYSGFVNNDTVASLATLPTVTTTATTSSHVAGAPYSISASGAVDPDYTITYVDGSLTITPVPLTITADNKTMVYGSGPPTLTASYRGLVNGDSAASLTTPPLLTTSATAASHVANNPYMVTASGASDADYTITYVEGTLTVTPAALTVTADNKSMVYGSTSLPTLTVSYNGLVNNDSAASLTTLPSLTTTATTSSHVAGSPYRISASGAADPDYRITYIDGSLTIAPAPLTISADNKIMPYGGSLPTLTASYSGLVNGDTISSLATLPTLNTTATATSHVSGNPYAITASGAVDTDYSITYVPGTLTINPVPLTITADNKSMVYGGQPTLTASYSGLVNGDTASSLSTPPTLTAPSSLHVSGSPYAITASGAVDADYSITYVAGTLTVTPAPLTIAADAQSKIYGQPDAVLSYMVNGLQLSDTAAEVLSGTLTRAAGETVAGSPYAITEGTLAANSDYTISFSGNSLTITPDKTTTVLLTPSTSVSAGQPITLTATVTPGASASDSITGSVVFLDQGTPLATVPVRDGNATFTSSALALGGHSLSAAYEGDANHIASGSSALAVTVVPAGTPNERFVQQLYVNLLSRQPDAEGLANWIAALSQGVSRTQVALAIEQSLEARADQVQALYQQFLHRGADPSGLNTFVTFLGTGGTLEQVRTILTSSLEYLQVQGGSTNDGFLKALYRDALNRSPDAGGLAGFMQALNHGASRQQIAAAIFGSPEYLRDLVAGYYELFLKRPADTGGLNSFVASLQMGVPDQSVIGSILGSEEFFSGV